MIPIHTTIDLTQIMLGGAGVTIAGAIFYMGRQIGGIRTDLKWIISWIDGHNRLHWLKGKEE